MVTTYKYLTTRIRNIYGSGPLVYTLIFKSRLLFRYLRNPKSIKQYHTRQMQENYLISAGQRGKRQTAMMPRTMAPPAR